MKKIILSILTGLAVLPVLLIFNESGEFWINLIGIVYLASLSIFANSKRAEKILGITEDDKEV